MHGCKVEIVDEWAVLASADRNIPEIFAITPYTPEPHDFFRVDTLRNQIQGLNPAPRGTVVHDADDLDPRAADLVDWIASARDLTAVLLRTQPGELLDVAP
jgi:hypothetical protein